MVAGEGIRMRTASTQHNTVVALQLRESFRVSKFICLARDHYVNCTKNLGPSCQTFHPQVHGSGRETRLGLMGSCLQT